MLQAKEEKRLAFERERQQQEDEDERHRELEELKVEEEEAEYQLQLMKKKASLDLELKRRKAEEHRKVKQKQEEEREAEMEKERQKKKKKSSDWFPANPWVGGAIFALCNLPLLVLLYWLPQWDSNAQRVGICHIAGKTLAITLLWPLEDAFSYMCRVLHRTQCQSQNRAEVEKHPVHQMWMSGLLRSRWKGEYESLTPREILLTFRDRWLFSVPCYLITTFTLCQSSYQVRRSPLVYMLHHLGFGIRSEALPVVCCYILVQVPAMLCCAICIAPMWTMVQQFSSSYDAAKFGELEVPRRLNDQAKDPKAAVKKGQKGGALQAGAQAKADASGTIISSKGNGIITFSFSGFFCSVARSPPEVFQFLGFAVGNSIRFGITMIIFDMCTGFLVGWPSRTGLCWGATIGCFAQMGAQIMYMPFDPSLRKSVSLRLPMAAASGALYLGFTHLLRVLLVPTVICTVHGCKEYTAQEMWEIYQIIPDCTGTGESTFLSNSCSWTDLILGHPNRFLGFLFENS